MEEARNASLLHGDPPSARVDSAPKKPGAAALPSKRLVAATLEARAGRTQLSPTRLPLICFIGVPAGIDAPRFSIPFTSASFSIGTSLG